MSNYISGIPISSNLQNHSYAKQMYSFPHSERFDDGKKNNYNFYNLPSQKSQRYTTFGFGKKYDIVHINFTESNLKLKPPIYDIRAYNCSSKHLIFPKYSFGLSREHFGKCLVGNETSGLTERSPGPAVYNVSKKLGEFGPKYSFRPKYIYKGKGFVLNVPGPGNYENYSTPHNGRYTLSNVENVKQTPWSKAKELRWKSVSKTTPGPGKYEIKGLINGKGSVYNSKYRSGTAKTFGLKLRNSTEVRKDDITPGPGAYDTFSEFGFYKNDDGRFDNAKYRKRTKSTIYCKTESDAYSLRTTHSSVFRRKSKN